MKGLLKEIKKKVKYSTGDHIYYIWPFEIMGVYEEVIVKDQIDRTYFKVRQYNNGIVIKNVIYRPAYFEEHVLKQKDIYESYSDIHNLDEDYKDLTVYDPWEKSFEFQGYLEDIDKNIERFEKSKPLKPLRLK